MFVSQRVYKFINFTLSDRFFPVFKTTDCLVDVRLVGKLASQKTPVFLFHFEVIGTMRR